MTRTNDPDEAYGSMTFRLTEHEYSGGAHPSEGLPVASSPSRLRLGCSRRKQESLATPPPAQGACWYNAKALLLDFSDRQGRRRGTRTRSSLSGFTYQGVVRMWWDTPPATLASFAPSMETRHAATLYRRVRPTPRPASACEFCYRDPAAPPALCAAVSPSHEISVPDEAGTYLRRVRVQRSGSTCARVCLAISMLWTSEIGGIRGPTAQTARSTRRCSSSIGASTMLHRSNRTLAHPLWSWTGTLVPS
ncbi:hypothetical protein C8Q76DRAFT_244915 [Earliella scabrosa]|nr:hypothetical protein C8Q76DRAFT_244915 [Earliella scabrosa]